MTDIWDGIGKTHVILALSPEECRAIIKVLLLRADLDFEHIERARKEIEYSLRDQGHKFDNDGDD